VGVEGAITVGSVGLEGGDEGRKSNKGQGIGRLVAS
jgi:hypothetical protein